MSETLRIGDLVVFRDRDNDLITDFGIATVVESGVSFVVVNWTGTEPFQPRVAIKIMEPWKFKADTLLFTANLPANVASPYKIGKLTDPDFQCFQRIASQDEFAELRKRYESATAAGIEGFTNERLQEVVTCLESDLPRKCQTCLWWRPPFTAGPGNCHNTNLIALTRANDDGFPPPTPATFGCVHWETKEEPENGDNSDE